MFNKYKNKYKLTHKTKEVSGHTLHRIQALKDFGDVKKDDLGGWIENYNNLSQSGDAWIYDEAKVYDNAEVSDHARIFDSAQVRDKAWVYDNALVFDHAQVFGSVYVGGSAYVYDNAKVYGSARVHGIINIHENDEIKDDGSYLVFKNTWSSGRDFVYVLSNHRWHVGSFNGTGDELIKKAYNDSELSGKMYEMYVHFAENVVKTQQQLKEM